MYKQFSRLLTGNVKVVRLAKGRVSIMYSKLLWGKIHIQFSLIQRTCVCLKKICQLSRCSFLLGKIRDASNLTIQCKKIDKESNYCQWSWAVRLAPSIVFPSLLCLEASKHIDQGRWSKMVVTDNDLTSIKLLWNNSGSEWVCLKELHLISQRLPHLGSSQCPYHRQNRTPFRKEIWKFSIY